MSEPATEVKELRFPCRACKEPIIQGSTVCPLCQRDQHKWVSLFNRSSSFLAALGVLATLFGSYLAFSSARNASAERVKAEVALEQAETALNSVKASESKIIEIQTSLQKTTGVVFRRTQQNLQLAWPTLFSNCGNEYEDNGYNCGTHIHAMLVEIHSTITAYTTLDEKTANLAGIDVNSDMGNLCRYINEISKIRNRNQDIPAVIQQSIDLQFAKVQAVCG